MKRSTLPLLLCAVAILGGCGVRGSLEAPRAQGAAAADPAKTASADSGQGKKQGDAPKPHQGFILDRLLE